jgi:RNA polymerase sigma-70 factor, ECF subfamily
MKNFVMSVSASLPISAARPGKGVVGIVLPTTERAAAAGEDRALVARVQAGEVGAFDELVRRYRERILGVVYHLTANREDAADLTQDVFIKAFRSLNRFQGQSAFFTWLYRIAINTALNHLQKARLRRFFSLEKIQSEDEPVVALLHQLTDGSPSVDRNAYLAELQQKLNEGMQKLSTKHRTVITLYEIDGLSHEEIAEVTGTSVGTVRSRLHYAKQQLQADLASFQRV